MSFTPGEKSAIRLAIGAPDQFRQVDTRLESILDNLSDTAEVQVRELLFQLAATDAQITGNGLATAHLARVDEIWFATSTTQIKELRRHGRMIVGRLSTILGVPVFVDVYGTSGWPS